MKNIIILTLLSLLLSSCSEIPSCDERIVKKTVIELVRKDLRKNFISKYNSANWDIVYDAVNYARDNGLDEDQIRAEKEYELQKLAEIYAEEQLKEIKLNFSIIRLLKVEKDIKKCRCASKLIIEGRESKKVVNIEYSAQYTEDNQVYVKVFYR